MDLSLHRAQNIGIKIGKPGEIRAFVFEVSLGVTRAPPQLDPESGMLLNLVKVDEITAKLKFFLNSRDWISFESLLNESMKFVNPLLAAQSVELAELRFTEKRGFYIGWREKSYMGREQIVDLDGDLYRLKSKAPLQKAGLFQDLGRITLKQLQSPNFFETHGDLDEIEYEHLARSERTILRR